MVRGAGASGSCSIRGVVRVHVAQVLWVSQDQRGRPAQATEEEGGEGGAPVFLRDVALKRSLEYFWKSLITPVSPRGVGKIWFLSKKNQMAYFLFYLDGAKNFPKIVRK